MNEYSIASGSMQVLAIVLPDTTTFYSINKSRYNPRNGVPFAEDE